MSETPDDATAGQDSREGGRGPTDIPEESPNSESEIALSEEVARQERKYGRDA